MIFNQSGNTYGILWYQIKQLKLNGDCIKKTWFRSRIWGNWKTLDLMKNRGNREMMQNRGDIWSLIRMVPRSHENQFLLSLCFNIVMTCNLCICELWLLFYIYVFKCHFSFSSFNCYVLYYRYFCFYFILYLILNYLFPWNFHEGLD